MMRRVIGILRRERGSRMMQRHHIVLGVWRSVRLLGRILAGKWERFKEWRQGWVRKFQRRRREII